MTSDDIITISTEKENANLIADITGTDEGITLDDLNDLNPSQKLDDIQSRLADLEDADVVTENDGEYRVTTTARDLFDAHGLFPVEAWRRQLQRVNHENDE